MQGGLCRKNCRIFGEGNFAAVTAVTARVDVIGKSEEKACLHAKSVRAGLFLRIKRGIMKGGISCLFLTLLLASLIQVLSIKYSG